MVGDFASFLASSIFTLPIFISLVKEKYPYKSDSGPSKWDLSLDDFHGIANYFVITPVYLQLYGVTTQQF